MKLVNLITAVAMAVMGVAVIIQMNPVLGGMIALGSVVLCPPLTTEEIKEKRKRLEQSAKEAIKGMEENYLLHKSNHIKRGKNND